MNPTPPQSSAMRPNRSILALGMSLVVSFGAILLMFSQVDMAEFWRYLRQAEVVYLILIIATYPISMALRTLRWNSILGESLGFWRSFHIINVSYLFNTVLPFRIGEFVRIFLIGREPNHSAGEALSATAVERLFDVMWALLCIGLGLLLIPDSSGLPQNVLTSLGVLIVVTLVGMGVILFLPPLHPFFLRIVRFFTGFLPTAFGEKLVKIAADTLASLKGVSDWRKLITVFTWSAITWFSYITFFYLGLFSFFEGDLPIGVGILVTGFTALGIAAPSLPGALGVFQAASILALTTAGYDTTIATSYAWVMWIAQTLVVIIGGVVGLSALSLSFSKITHDLQTQTLVDETLPTSS